MQDLNLFYKETLKNASDWLKNKIDNKKGKASFEETITLLLNNIYFENLEDLEIFLEEKIIFLKEIKNSWWSLRKYSKNTEYELKAYQLAYDVCHSFVTRFIKFSGNDKYYLG